MKVFIRDCASGLFFSSLGFWVRQDCEPYDFKTSVAALHALPFCGRETTEVVLHSADADSKEIVLSQTPPPQP